MFTLPSTRRFYRESKSAPDHSIFNFIHGYVYGRWPYFYISVGTREHPLGEIIAFLYRVTSWFFEGNHGDQRKISAKETAPGRSNGNGVASRMTYADTYHGKVVPLEEAGRLVTIGQDIEVKNLEHVIPYAAARDIVLKNPDHIAVLQCPCRTARKNPCKPLDVCIIVGEPFASFTLEHHPERSRRITPAEAVDILTQEDQRGHVHHAFFKDAMLGRFYAICNCCSCCCGAMQAHRSGTPMLASSGYIAVVNRQLCVSCGTCSKYCQFEAISYFDGVKRINTEACMGCGICVRKCTKGAVTLERDTSKSPPLEVEELMKVAMFS